MAAATFDLTGDNRIMQGADFSYGVKLWNRSVTPKVALSLVGATLKSQIRKKSGAPVLAEFTVTITNAANGQATLALPASVTATLPGTSSEAFLQHDLLLTRADGTRIVLHQGLVEVDDRITIPA
jgi:hypothetical protein